MALLVAAAAGALLALGRLARDDGPTAGTEPSSRAPKIPSIAGSFAGPPEPAFQVSQPTLLEDADVSLWAPIVRATEARATPGGGPVVARLGTRTPEGTTNIVVVLARAKRAGRLWVRVRLPVLPNGTTGWVRREALGGYVPVRTRLVVDLARLRAVLLRDGHPRFRAPIGVGRPRWPTPAGRFYIRNKLTKFESPFYGPVAFGTSARSAVLTDWPLGGFVGIHGTDRPDLLPGRISHGCIRMRNDDILRLAKMMPVGTPVTVRS